MSGLNKNVKEEHKPKQSTWRKRYLPGDLRRPLPESIPDFIKQSM